MSTLPPPATKKFPEDSIEKKCYAIAELLTEFIPAMNERNRLGFNLYKYVTGEGDAPEIIVRNAKIVFQGITEKELVNKISAEIEKIK